jgi:hypothetical protein
MCWKAWWYGHDYDACGCYWPGEYKWPVPPYYTYHWPGQYASPVVAEYTPLRFEPLMLPPQPEDVVSVKYQVRETFRKSIERLRNPNGDGPVAPSKPAPTAAPVPRPAPQRGDEQSRLVPDPRFEDPRQPAPTPMYQALPRQTGVQQSFGVANGWPAPLPGAWAPFKRRPANP